MGISTREKGILKLVHPGRHVEIHREPIAAAEVMKKYPRHCITRPDVFKFPWVVVKPEAILLPGKVFYVVPCRTIYQLLKDRRQKNQHTPRRDCSDKNGQELPDLSSDNYFPSYKLINGENHDRLDPSLPHKKTHHSSSLTSLPKNDPPHEKHHSISQGSGHLRIRTLKISENNPLASQETTPIRSSAGRTPKHIHGIFQNSPRFRSRDEEELSQSSPDKPAYYSLSTELASSSSKKMKGYYHNSLHVSSDDRSLDKSYSYSGRRQYTNNTKNVSRLGISSSRVHEAVHLKSCLRKPGNDQRRLNLRVRFASSVLIPSRERDSPTLQPDIVEL